MKLNELELSRLQNIVCSEVGTTPKIMKSKSRKTNIVKARQIYSYLLVSVFQYSLTDAAEEAGGFDHSTVIHSVKTVQNLAETDKGYAFALNIILDKAQNLKNQIEEERNKKPDQIVIDIIERATQLIEEMKQLLIAQGA